MMPRTAITTAHFSSEVMASSSVSGSVRCGTGRLKAGN
jgi:hypothetical protein